MLRSTGFVTCLALLMVACGGGGGSGGGSGASAPPPPLLSSAPGDAALGQYLRGGHDYTLHTSHSGDRYTMQYSVFHNRTFGHSTFQGVGPAYADVTSIHIQVNDEPISDSASVAFYLLDPVVPLGTISYVDGIPYGIVTSSFPLPATLTVGDSGAFDNVTYYHDSTMSSVVADETGTYSVLAKDSRSLLFCLNSTISAVTEQGSADGLDNGTETVCYTVDASGTADLASVALMVNGVALNFR